MSGAGYQSTSANFLHRHSAFLFPAARLCPLITGYFRPLVGDKHSTGLTTGLIGLCCQSPHCLHSAHQSPCSGHTASHYGFSPNHPLFRWLFCLEGSAPIFGSGNCGSSLQFKLTTDSLSPTDHYAHVYAALSTPDTVAGNTWNGDPGEGMLLPCDT